MVQKRQEDYEKILEILNLPPPQNLVSDFELAAIKAFESYYGEGNFKVSTG